MSKPQQCRRCGSTSAGEWSGGLCAACTFEFGLLGYADETAPEPPPVTADELPPAGRRFGDYQLLQEVASGGMGVVYRALQVRLNRVVALKMIRAGHLARAEDRARFRAEAEAAARLQHPNIVGIHEIGEHGGQPFFTMTFIEGWSLAELIQQHPLRPDQAARYVLRIAEAIHYAHQRGVLHRDLKPSNIVVDASDEPHVTDFGLAKVLAGDSGLTRSGAVLGSPSYMPPEQAQGRLEAVEARSDVYALGAILYELLTGAPPFRASSAVATLRLVVEQDPVPPRALNGSLPRDLEIICLKCLAKSPAARYASAAELAAELGRFLNDEPIRARPAGAGEKLGRWCRRQPVVAGSLAASFLLLAAFALVSTRAALRLRREAEHTRRAQQEAEEMLLASQLDRARAERHSGIAGRRARGLAAITAAAGRRPSLELRNEAIATLALPDLGTPLITWESSRAVSGNGLGFDADLERCALARQEGVVAIYRVQDQHLLLELAAPALRPDGVQFGPNGRFLSVAYGQTELVVWNLDQRTVVLHTRQRADGTHAAFNAQSTRLALIAPEQRVQCFDLASGKPLAPLAPETAPLWLDYAPNTEELAIGGPDQVEFWDAAAGRRVRAFRPPSRATCVDWHRDGHPVALGLVSGEVVLWNPGSDRHTTLAAHSCEVIRVGFHPGGEMLWSTADDGFTRFWDAVNGSPLFATQQGQARQTSRNGALLSLLRWNHSIGLWPVITNQVLRTLYLPALDEELLNLSLSRDGRWLLVGASAGWHLFETATGAEICAVPLGRRVRVALHPHEPFVAGVTADAVLRWPLSWRTHAATVTASVGAAETLLSAPDKALQRLSFSPDGERLAVVGHHQSAILNWAHPQDVIPFSRGVAQSFVSLSPDPQRLAAADYFGKGVTLWDGRSGEAGQTLIPSEQAQVGFSPNGATLITLSQECVFWDTASWRPRRRVDLQQGPLSDSCLGFSGDSRMVAVVDSYQLVRLFDPETGDELATLTPPGRLNLVALTLSADGSVVAAATQKGSVYVWNLRALHRELAPLNLDW